MELLLKAVEKYKTNRHIASNLKDRFWKFFKNMEITVRREEMSKKGVIPSQTGSVSRSGKP